MHSGTKKPRRSGWGCGGAWRAWERLTQKTKLRETDCLPFAKKRGRGGGGLHGFKTLGTPPPPRFANTVFASDVFD